MTYLEILQWLGCVTSATGALLLALNNRHSRYGFVLFLIANGFWIVYGIETHAPGLIANQVFFTGTSLVGIYKWIIATPDAQKTAKSIPYKIERINGNA